MLLTIIGTRPQYIKSSIVSFALKQIGVAEKKVDTCQHYDNVLSKQIVDSLPFESNINTLQNEGNYESILIQLEKNLQKDLHKIKAVLVYGDTHSAMAGALFAKKNFKKLIHIEAGERSGMIDMKEEFNRINIDYLSDICLCINKKSFQNLSYKKKSEKTIVGDVMLDLVQHPAIKAVYEKKTASKKTYIYFTLHRDENTKNGKKFHEIINSIKEIKQEIIWPVHPRNNHLLKTIKLPSNIKLVKPVSYTKGLSLMANADMVITDSGGLQKEAYWLKKKCITLRPSTEWTETLPGNWNILVSDFNKSKLKKAILQKPDEALWNLAAFGNGDASQKIAAIIKKIIID